MQALFIIRTLNHIICLPFFNIYNWFISQNPDFFSFRKIHFFFHFTKFRFTDLRPRFQIAKIVPWNARSFIIRTLHHIICLPLFNIYNWFISQNSDFFTDLQQTVCGCNWFISQNPDIFFFISQNPDFINVVENVDFAKSRFFLFRRIQIFLFRRIHISQFRKIHISQNPVSLMI